MALVAHRALEDAMRGLMRFKADAKLPASAAGITLIGA